MVDGELLQWRLMKTVFSMRAVMGGLLGGDYTARPSVRWTSPPNATMKTWDAFSVVNSLGLGENWLLYYSSIIQKLNGVFILAIFPH